MSPLGPKARALVQSGRSALRPAEGARDRVEDALRARLGADVLPPQGSVPPAAAPPATAAAGWQMAVGAAVGAGLIGAALYLGFSPERGGTPPDGVPPLPRVVESAPQPDRPGEASLLAPPPEAPAAPPAIVSAAPPSVTRAVPPRSQDRLAEEVSLLSRATTALRDGRAGEALKVLDEHQAKFPRGALNEERRAAKAQALCALGRLAEGRAVLSQLAPRSPAAARATQACIRP